MLKEKVVSQVHSTENLSIVSWMISCCTYCHLISSILSYRKTINQKCKLSSVCS